MDWSYKKISMLNHGLDRRWFLKRFAAAVVGAGAASSVKAVNAPSQLQKALKDLRDHDGDQPRLVSHNVPDLLTTLQPYPTINANRGTEKFWRQVRKTFVLDDYIHMNTGTTGSMPYFAMLNQAVYNVAKSMDPRDWEANLNSQYPDLFPRPTTPFGPFAFVGRQAWIAAMYDANPDEIVLSYDTTDACNLIFSGTPWQPGDRIVTTHWEHPALEGPMAWARDYHGVTLSVVALPSNFDSSWTVPQVVAMFQAALAQPLPAGAKQYLALSEVTYKNGLRLPIKELATMAKTFGAYVIVDSAHGWGMLPVKCHDYGADFIAGAGHKWLCGGPGTGICYVRTSGNNLPPFAMGNFFLYGDPFQVSSPNKDSRNWPPNLYTQYRGEFNTPALYAMTDVANYFNYIGIQDIYTRGVTLGNYLKQKIVAKWSPRALWVQANPDPAFATALTSFNPFAGKDDSTQFDAMNTAMNTILANLAANDPKIYIRSTTWRDTVADPGDNRVGFRVATHGVYMDTDQIDYFFDQLVAQVNATGLPQVR